MFNFTDISQAVIAGQDARVKELVQDAINNGAEPLAIINEGLIAGMNVVGASFKSGKMFVPEVLMSARSMRAGVELVKPLLAGQDVPSAGKVIIGTVKGDLHDLGKNLVAMMLEGGGFNVVNLGIDLPPEKFVAAVKEHQPQIIGLSALLTTTMLVMKDVIELLKEEGLRDKVKVIVGGAPISYDFASEIGADGFAPDAASAVELCRRLLS